MRSLLTFGLLIAGVAGCGYLATALQRTIAFKRKASATKSDFVPPVTVLKPLCGDEPRLYEKLASFCDQDYPDFQVIFGVREADDPALGVARRIVESFPNANPTLVIDPRVDVANHKMANVLNMMSHAKHDLIVVADSDVCVDRFYLRRIVAPFSDPQVGAVTCLYRASAQSANAANGREPIVETLGAMFVEEQFAPSVLVAIALDPMDFCLGATMAVSRRALDAIGGFEAVASYLADDQKLGQLVRDAGYHVELSSYVVETDAADQTLRALWEHELRWALTMHSARPWGFSLSFITYALPLACAYAMVSANRLVGSVLVLSAASLRLGVHYAARSALEVRSPDRPWLILVRDFFGLAVWAAHFFARNIRWRETTYRLDSSGRLKAL